MKHMNTKEMLDIALKLAGLEECPADSGEIVAGENINRVLAGLDINNPELGVAMVMKYDAIVGHHPRTEDLKGCSRLMEELPLRFLVQHGVGLVAAKKAVAGRCDKADKAKNPIDHNREAASARLAGMPFMTIHSPATMIAERIVQDDMDERFGGNDLVTLDDVLAAISEYPECKAWSLTPKILIGEPNSHAGRIVAMFTGLSEVCLADVYQPQLNDAEIFKALFRSGVGTLIVKSLGEDEKKTIEEQSIGNVICLGHMCADSIGMNRIIDEWEKHGLKVDRFCGILG